MTRAIDGIVAQLAQAERTSDWFGPPKRSSYCHGTDHQRPDYVIPHHVIPHHALPKNIKKRGLWQKLKKLVVS